MMSLESFSPNGQFTEVNHGSHLRPEIALPSRAITIVGRHAEPDIYGDEHSELTNSGKIGASNMARNIFDLVNDGGRPKIVRVFASARERTTETAEIIWGHFAKEIEVGVPGITLMEGIKIVNFISPDKTIDALVRSGIPLDQAYEKWLVMNDSEAENFGAITTGEVANNILNIAASYGKVVSKLNSGPDRINIFSGHETHLGAVLKHTLGRFEKIGYSEYGVIVGGNGSDMNINFRGENHNFVFN